MLADQAGAHRVDDNERRPHEAIASNRPKEVHMGLGDPTTPTPQTKETLTTT
jgi:hypothetical protein